MKRPIFGVSWETWRRFDKKHFSLFLTSFSVTGDFCYERKTLLWVVTCAGTATLRQSMGAFAPPQCEGDAVPGRVLHVQEKVHRSRRMLSNIPKRSVIAGG